MNLRIVENWMIPLKILAFIRQRRVSLVPFSRLISRFPAVRLCGVRKSRRMARRQAANDSGSRARAADDLLTICALHPRYERRRREFRGRSSRDLADVVCGSERIEERVGALWRALGGGPRHLGERRPRRQTEAAFERLSEAGWPGGLVEVARVNFNRTGEPLAPLLALLAQRPMDRSRVDADEFPPRAKRTCESRRRAGVAAGRSPSRRARGFHGEGGRRPPAAGWPCGTSTRRAAAKAERRRELVGAAAARRPQRYLYLSRSFARGSLTRGWGCAGGMRPPSSLATGAPAARTTRGRTRPSSQAAVGDTFAGRRRRDRPSSARRSRR